MRKTIFYGVLVAGIFASVVIASSDLVFAAPEDEIDYSFVSAIDEDVTLNCPNQNTPAVTISFEYSEKTTSGINTIVRGITIGNEFGVLSSGFVTKDNFAVRGIMYKLLDVCGFNDGNIPTVVTLVGNCSLDEESTLTTDRGISATFGNVGCS